MADSGTPADRAASKKHELVDKDLNESHTGVTRKRGRQMDRGPEQSEPKDKSMSGEPWRKPMRKFAILFGYSGTGYQGLQRNPGAKSIEDELAQALLKAELIHERGHKFLQDVNWQRTARTDKGVHAARQIVSLKMAVEEKSIDKINAHLPDSIRVFKLLRVTKKFNCKIQCSGRLYRYVLPTYTFTPKGTKLSTEFRMDPEKVKEVNRVLQYFVGTRNFYNFTSGRKIDDASCKRYIVSFTASEPILEDNLEYVNVYVRGQSFMLNQIRKMIGLAVAVVTGYADETVFDMVFSEQVDVPRIPGLGLLLDNVYFEPYNKKLQRLDDSAKEMLTWEDKHEEIEAFTVDRIIRPMLETEKETQEIYSWLGSLPLHYSKQRVAPDEPSKVDDAVVATTAPSTS